jgi:hypothetical protein
LLFSPVKFLHNSIRGRRIFAAKFIIKRFAKYGKRRGENFIGEKI